MKKKKKFTINQVLVINSEKIQKGKNLLIARVNKLNTDHYENLLNSKKKLVEFALFTLKIIDKVSKEVIREQVFTMKTISENNSLYKNFYMYS